MFNIFTYSCLSKQQVLSNNFLHFLQVVVCLLAEEIVIDRGLVKLMDSPFWLKLRPRKEKYLAVEKEIKMSDWPPVQKSAVELSSIVTSSIAQK